MQKGMETIEKILAFWHIMLIAGLFQLNISTPAPSADLNRDLLPTISKQLFWNHFCWHSILWIY